MKSSSGEHYIALDHVRALAALLVFCWHFMHGFGGHVPTNYVPALFPFSIFNQGHTGVALFMALSGYLFAKLLDGKRIRYPAFFWNRSLRLFPLLILVLLAVGYQNDYLHGKKLVFYAHLLLSGFILPVWPNGGWSVVAELQFYLLLPLILFLARKSRWSLPILILAAIGLRVLLYQQSGQVQVVSYFSLVGRIDQFLFGILAFQLRKYLAGRHIAAGALAIAFLLFYWYFDLRGGFNNNPSYPSTSAIWIFLPTVEGLAYALLIGYYDNSHKPAGTGVSGFIAQLGAYSYSIYLLHFFIIIRLPIFINGHIMGLSNFYVSFAWALICFLAMFPIGYLSFRFIESPFLKFRKKYIIS